MVRFVIATKGAASQLTAEHRKTIEVAAKLLSDCIEKLDRFELALSKIAAGEGCYGAQARKYKNIALEALGLKKL